jgi:colicin import membrane protein
MCIMVLYNGSRSKANPKIGANAMSGITKEQVFEAAEALLAAGLTPKVASVREKLGKGSFSTVGPLLKEWFEGNKPPEAPKKEETPKAVEDLASGMWTAALGIALESLEGERQEIENQRLEMQEEKQEAVEFADKLVEEVEQLRTQLQESKELLEIERAAHESTRNLWQVDQNELVQLRADYNAAVDRSNDYKGRAERNEHLLGKSEHENKNLLKRESEQESRIARLESGLEMKDAEMKHQVSTLVDELDREREKAAKAVKAAEVDRAAAHAAQIETATLKGEVEALRLVVSEAKKNQQQQPKRKAGESSEQSGN